MLLGDRGQPLPMDSAEALEVAITALTGDTETEGSSQYLCNIIAIIIRIHVPVHVYKL